jgi:hypothetical protein
MTIRTAKPSLLLVAALVLASRAALADDPPRPCCWRPTPPVSQPRSSILDERPTLELELDQPVLEPVERPILEPLQRPVAR